MRPDSPKSMYTLQAPGPDMAMHDADDEDQLLFSFMFQVFRCIGPTVIIVAAALMLRLRVYSYAGGSDTSILKIFKVSYDLLQKGHQSSRLSLLLLLYLITPPRCDARSLTLEDQVHCVVLLSATSVYHFGCFRSTSATSQTCAWGVSSLLHRRPTLKKEA